MKIKWFDAQKNPPKKSGEYLTAKILYGDLFIHQLNYSAVHDGWNLRDWDESRKNEITDIVAWAVRPTTEEFKREVGLEE